jgi:hypothetical protein
MSMGIIYMGDMNSARDEALPSITKKASNVNQNNDGVKVEGMFSYFFADVGISVDVFATFDSNVKFR